MLVSKSLLVAAATTFALVSAGPIDRRAAVAVALEPVGNAEVKVKLTNTGTSDLSFLKYGTVFDSAPVRKLTLTRKNGT